MQTPQPQTNPPLSLQRKVGLLGVVTFGAGTAIGVSIFSVLAPTAKAAGTGLLLAMVIAALPMVIYGLVYSFLSSALPKSGASYEWPRQLIHPLVGFMVAWLRIVSNVGAIVVLAFVLVSYLSSIAPLPLKPTMAAAITASFVLNYLGVRVAARAQLLLMVLLLVVLAAFVTLGAPRVRMPVLGSPLASGWLAIFSAVPLMITLFMGIESAAEIGEEVEDAARTIPRGIALAVLLTLVVYGSVALVALGLVGPDALAASSTPLLEAARQPFGAWAPLVIVGAATVAILKSLNSITLVFSRSIFAMGRSGALPRSLGALHPRHGTPHAALGVCYLACMAGLALPSSLTFLLLSVNVPTVLKYMSSSLCALCVVRRYPQVYAQARIRFSRPLVLMLGSLGLAIGAMLLAAGATADARPYELIGLWCVCGLGYWLISRKVWLASIPALGVVFVLLHIDARAAPTSAPPTPDMVTPEGALKSPSTAHKVIVSGTAISYHAWFEETLLYASNQLVQAGISATSYVRSGIKDPQHRPVLFAFNGGPGASSSPLHFNALGPKRTERDAAGARHLVDNESSLIDAADLVFIDPVGTGFSRERPGTASGTYFSPRADARAALDLIRRWLHEQGRERSPLFIAGESYGGFRVALMMQDLKDLPIAGLILISPGLDMSAASGGASGNDLAYILDLPSMAVAAWEHDKVPRAGRDLAAVFGDAVRFAETDFALALLQGAAISPGERHRLAQAEAAFIGLPADRIEQANLRVDSQLFLEQLLGDDKIVGRLDTRIVADKPKQAVNPDRPAAANDPALGLGAPNVIKSQIAKAYFENDLKLTTDRDYLALSLDINFRWNWSELMYDKDPKDPSFYINPTVHIGEVMKLQPQMRLLLIGGYYDLAVPLLAPRYALAHAGVPLERVSMRALPGPHSPFEGQDNLRDGTVSVREFLSGGRHDVHDPID